MLCAEGRLKHESDAQLYLVYVKRHLLQPANDYSLHYKIRTIFIHSINHIINKFMRIKWRTHAEDNSTSK